MLDTISRRPESMRRALRFTAFSLLLGLWAPAAALGQIGGVDLDTVRAGTFDYGKMWTFEYPPAEYFSATYGFDADADWFERARLSVLRIPGCSASFVSPQGLVATNGWCTSWQKKAQS